MGLLVRHFGDEEDAARPCGCCDACDPAAAMLRMFRRATARERRWVQDIMDALRSSSYKTPKALRSELPWAESLDRSEFDVLLGAMARAGLIDIEEAEFEKDGRVIPFRKIGLTDGGLRTGPDATLELLLDDGVVEEFVSSRQPRPRKSPVRPPLGDASKASARTPGGVSTAKAATPGMAGSKTNSAQLAKPIALSATGAALAGRLRAWRTAEAKRLRVPAFTVLRDSTLNAIAATRPSTPHELLAIAGMGPSKIGRFGAAILELCATEK